MLDTVLRRRGATAGTRMLAKLAVAFAVVISAVLLPQLVHLVYGAPGGVRFLPMYLPVLIGGALLGYRVGLCVGVLSPVVSYLVTSLSGSPMPAALRLPFMAAELAVFALVMGLFSKKIAKTPLLAFPAVWCAELLGRGTFLLSSALFGSLANLPPETVLSQIVAGLPGLLIQALLAPALILLFAKLLRTEDEA